MMGDRCWCWWWRWWWLIDVDGCWGYPGCAWRGNQVGWRTEFCGILWRIVQHASKKHLSKLKYPNYPTESNWIHVGISGDHGNYSSLPRLRGLRSWLRNLAESRMTMSHRHGDVNKHRIWLCDTDMWIYNMYLQYVYKINLSDIILVLQTQICTWHWPSSQEGFFSKKGLAQHMSRPPEDYSISGRSLNIAEWGIEIGLGMVV